MVAETDYLRDGGVGSVRGGVGAEGWKTGEKKKKKKKKKTVHTKYSFIGKQNKQTNKKKTKTGKVLI